MRRTTLLAVLVFFGLGALAALVMTRNPERGIVRMSLAGIDLSVVDRMEISGPMPVVLRRDGNIWRLANDREADLRTVQGALSLVPQIASSDQLTTDSSRFAFFEADDTAGHSVVLRSSDTPVVRFVVGKSLAGGAAVRVGDAVYKVAHFFPGAFARPANEWLEKRIIKKELDDVAQVQVHLHGQSPYAVGVQDANWALVPLPQVTYPALRFDPEAARLLAMGLANLRAHEILDADPGVATTHLSAEQADSFKIVLKDEGEGLVPGTKPEGGASATTLLLGANKDEHSIYAKLDGRSDVYLLTDGTAQALRKKLVDLRNLTLMQPVVEQDVRQILIQNGKAKVTLSRDAATAPWVMQSTEKLSKNFVLDQSKANRRIALLTTARALGVASMQSKLVGAKSFVQLRLADKRLVTLRIGGPAQEAPGACYGQGDRDDDVYTLTAGLHDSLLGLSSSFEKVQEVDALSQLDPASLSGLPPDIRKSLEGQIAQRKAQQAMLKRAAAAVAN